MEKQVNLTESQKALMKSTFSQRDVEMMVYALIYARKAGIETAMEELAVIREEINPLHSKNHTLEVQE